MSGPCRRCKERGKTWEGDDPECAFTKTFFSPDNWNCATMNALRDLAEERTIWNDDSQAAILPIPDGGFLVLRWYKNRGRTEVAAVLSTDGEFLAFGIRTAENILGNVAALDDCGYWLTVEEADAYDHDRLEPPVSALGENEKGEK